MVHERRGFGKQWPPAADTGLHSTLADDPATQIIVEKCLEPARIVEIQQKVLAGELVPGY